jgi:hypothetical protein
MAYVYTGDARFKVLRIQKTDSGGVTTYDQTFNILDAFASFQALTPDQYAQLSDSDAQLRINTFVDYVAAMAEHAGMSTDVDLAALKAGAISVNNNLCPQGASEGEAAI